MAAEFGGKRFAVNFKNIVESTLAKAAADSGRIVQDAADELASEMRSQAKGAARVIREEARAVREAFMDYTGNNPPEDESGVAEATAAASSTAELPQGQAEGGPAPSAGTAAPAPATDQAGSETPTVPPASDPKPAWLQQTDGKPDPIP